jgi:ssDNA-binding Zn-finger/Zn-ribbon topoisomerase 1
MSRNNAQEDEQLCEQCGTEMHVRQSWTGRTYHMCPECN